MSLATLTVPTYDDDPSDAQTTVTVTTTVDSGTGYALCTDW